MVYSQVPAEYHVDVIYTVVAMVGMQSQMNAQEVALPSQLLLFHGQSTS